MEKKKKEKPGQYISRWFLDTRRSREDRSPQKKGRTGAPAHGQVLVTHRKNCMFFEKHNLPKGAQEDTKNLTSFSVC